LSDVTKLVKICIRRMQIFTFKIRRMRMRKKYLFYQSKHNALVK